MTVRTRLDPDEAPARVAHVPDDGGGESEELRNEGAAFLAAADAAITRALSRNSEQFLAQNRQQGGQ